MDNYLVVLLLSAVILIGAFYGNTVEQRIFQIKNDLLKHEKEIKEVKKVKVELESTKKELTQVKVDLESTRKELKQAQVELESTRNALNKVKVDLESTRKELKQAQVELESTRNALNKVKVDLDSTREQMKILRTEMIEKDNARRKEINQIRADVIALPDELNKIKKELHTRRPGFYATLSPSYISLIQFQRIQFDHTMTDITNNYDKLTGVFTVPTDGLYYFSLTIFSQSGQIHAEIVQNDRVIGKSVGVDSYISASINVVISCRQNDAVFVRHMAGVGVQIIYGAGFTAFSGFLID